jgi:hypothetical protein
VIIYGRLMIIYENRDKSAPFPVARLVIVDGAFLRRAQRLIDRHAPWTGRADPGPS